MRDGQRYPFVAADSDLGEASMRPYLPLILDYQGRASSTAGLLDTGAAVNVLPYRVGAELGAVWGNKLLRFNFQAIWRNLRLVFC